MDPARKKTRSQPILNGTAGETLTTGVAYPMNINQILANFNPNSPNASFQPRVYAVGYHIPEVVLSYTASVQQTLPDSSVLTIATTQYGWSHNIGTSTGSNETTTSENNYNFSSEHGDNASDLRQILNMAALYQLPFGRGQRNDFGGNRLLDGMFGGWQLGENLNFHTGLPINALMTRNNVLYNDPQNGAYYTNPVLVGGKPITTAVINIPGGGQSRGTQRPNLVPGVDPYVNTSSGFMLNPAAFSIPAPGTYGNLGRDALRGPGLAQLDMTISKQFRITEKMHAELRGDVYYLPNHPNFANPPSTLSGGVPSGPASSGIQPGQAFTTSAAGSAFGLLNAAVSKYINDGTARQIQIALRFTF